MFGAKRKNTADISESGNPRHPEATARVGIPATRKLGARNTPIMNSFLANASEMQCSRCVR